MDIGQFPKIASAPQEFKLNWYETKLIYVCIAYKMELALGVPSARFWIERERLYRESLVNQID